MRWATDLDDLLEAKDAWFEARHAQHTAYMEYCDNLEKAKKQVRGHEVSPAVW